MSDEQITDKLLDKLRAIARSDVWDDMDASLALSVLPRLLADRDRLLVNLGRMVHERDTAYAAGRREQAEADAAICQQMGDDWAAEEDLKEELYACRDAIRSAASGGQRDGGGG